MLQQHKIEQNAEKYLMKFTDAISCLNVRSNPEPEINLAQFEINNLTTEEG